MKAGDLVKWTFAKASKVYNKDSISYLGVLLKEERLSEGMWQILLQSGKIVQGDITEIEVVKESEDR